MKTHWLRFGLLGLALTALGWVGAQDATEGRDKTRSLQKAMDAYAAAMNQGDVDTVIGFWAKDADYTDAEGNLISGQKAIAEQIKENLANLKGSKIRFVIDKLRFLRPDVAAEDGHSVIVDADGGSEKGHYHVLWVKTDGKWLISSVRVLPGAAGEGEAAVDHLQPLAWMVGEWTPEDKTVSMTVKCHWALNKRFLVVDYAVKGKDGDDLAVTNWIGWDPENESLHSWVFDSLGGLGNGYWARAGNTWTIDATGVLPDGGSASAVNSIRRVNDTTFIWRSSDREVDGVPVADNEIRFVKK